MAAMGFVAELPAVVVRVDGDHHELIADTTKAESKPKELTGQQELSRSVLYRVCWPRVMLHLRGSTLHHS